MIASASASTSPSTSLPSKPNHESERSSFFLAAVRRLPTIVTRCFGMSLRAVSCSDGRGQGRGRDCGIDVDVHALAAWARPKAKVRGHDAGGSGKARRWTSATMKMKPAAPSAWPHCHRRGLLAASWRRLPVCPCPYRRRRRDDAAPGGRKSQFLLPHFERAGAMSALSALSMKRKSSFSCRGTGRTGELGMKNCRAGNFNKQNSVFGQTARNGTTSQAKLFFFATI